jgi:hypothetical protein
MPAPYNPASDGFTAKAWECLRRNKAFQSDWARALLDRCDDSVKVWQKIKSPNPNIEELSRYLDNPAKPINVFKSRMATHPFYQAVFEPLVEWSQVEPEDKETCHYRARSLDLGMTWPDIHPDTRGYLENGLCPYGAFPVATPDRAEIDPYGKDYNPAKAKEFLSNLTTDLDTHRIICVPVTVWDREHKERIISEVADLLGKPLAKDARWLKDNGRTLGSEAEWRAYLLVEQWREPRGANYGVGMAANLAAWEIYGKEDFGIEPQDRIKAAKAFREGCSKTHKYTSKVDKQVKLVERAIKSVYPVFDPIQSD